MNGSANTSNLDDPLAKDENSLNQHLMILIEITQFI